MSVNVNTRCFILSLFIRDDGERMLLGSGRYDFKNKQQHFVANSIVSDTVDVQGTDGTLLAGQVRRASTQPFDGYVGDATSTKVEVEEYRREFIEFFAKNHFYSVVYVFSDGTAIKRQRGFVVDAPEVKELFQIQPEYHVALNFEDVNYYEYNEDEDGNEIYSQMFKIARTDSVRGGLIWDGYGAVMIDMTIAQNTVSGTSITISDALPMPPEDVKLYGDTTQSGIPSPSDPQPINVATSVQSITISDGTNTRSVEVNLGKNLLDLTTITTNTTLTPTTGATSSNSSYNTSDYIPVIGGKNVIIADSSVSSNRTYVLCQYDSTKTYIAGVSQYTSGLTVALENDAAYVRVAYNKALTQPQFEYGSTATSYSTYFTPIELCKIGSCQDYIYEQNGDWVLHKETAKILSYNGETVTTSYVSTTGQLTTSATVYYALTTPIETQIINADTLAGLNQLGGGSLYAGTNNILVSSENLSSTLQLTYDVSGGDNPGGFEWGAGGGGSIVSITVDSISEVYPLITITGPAINPTLENVTTSTTMSYVGTVATGQALIIDTMAQTAKLNGTNVVQNLYGDWLFLAPGVNRVAYTTTNSDAPEAEGEFNEIVG